MTKYKIAVIASSFSQADKTPLEILQNIGVEYVINEKERKLDDTEILELASDADIIIAGTENLENIVKTNKKLKLISRIGVGLNSVPLNSCKKKNIQVIYTPDAVIDSVAELTIGHMLSAIRKINQLDRSIRNKSWKRILGSTISSSVIGIIGYGRIARKVEELILPFSPSRILINDIVSISHELSNGIPHQQVDLDYLIKESNIITLHLPLNDMTKNIINKKNLSEAKENVFFINTSRGGILNESDLYEFLINNKYSGAAIDVFQNEPYEGKLIELENVVLTSHIGSYTDTCRVRMELEAIEDIIHFIKGERMINVVPEYEYEKSSL